MRHGVPLNRSVRKGNNDEDLLMKFISSELLCVLNASGDCANVNGAFLAEIGSSNAEITSGNT